MKENDNSYLENNFNSILLKSHSQYLDLLNAIREDTERIILVQTDDDDQTDPVVNAAKEMMTLEKREIVSEWLGTISPGRDAIQYTFLIKRKFFDYSRSSQHLSLIAVQENQAKSPNYSAAREVRSLCRLQGSEAPAPNPNPDAVCTYRIRFRS